MPLAKIHVLEGRYDQSRIQSVIDLSGHCLGGG
jgi:hypothetical protein